MKIVQFDPNGAPLIAKAVFKGKFLANYEMLLREKNSNINMTLIDGDNANDEDDVAPLPQSAKINETQIASILKQYDGGREPMELCREYGTSKATLYNWRKKYAGMDSSHIKEMKALQDENRRLKQMYAELMLDHQVAKHIIEKKL